MHTNTCTDITCIHVPPPLEPRSLLISEPASPSDERVAFLPSNSPPLLDSESFSLASVTESLSFPPVLDCPTSFSPSLLSCVGIAENLGRQFVQSFNKIALGHIRQWRCKHMRHKILPMNWMDEVFTCRCRKLTAFPLCAVAQRIFAQHCRVRKSHIPFRIVCRKHVFAARRFGTDVEGGGSVNDTIRRRFCHVVAFYCVTKLGLVTGF